MIPRYLVCRYSVAANVGVSGFRRRFAITRLTFSPVASGPVRGVTSRSLINFSVSTIDVINPEGFYY